MVRLLATAVVAFLSNAVGLIVAALILDDVRLGTLGFVIAVLIFTGVSVLIEPLLRQTAMKRAPALLGSTALLTVLVSLIVTAIISDSLSINGLVTWVLATIVVWLISFVGRLVFPLLVFKKTLSAARSSRSA